MTGPSYSVDEMLERADRLLRAHWAKRSPSVGRAWGEGPDGVGLAIVSDCDPVEDRVRCNAARAWRRELWEAGLGWPSGPPELGGLGLAGSAERALRALEATYDTPDPGYTRIGLSIVGPAIQAHGSSKMREKYLPAIRRGDVLVCQLLSEPEAGSDLGNVSTRARRDGDTWVVSGWKVWTSGAHHADIGECLAVTEPDADRRKRMTMFLVDMHAPGVEIRPLRQMTGGSEFSEVLLNEVRVPDSCRLGAPGAGWQVAISTLLNERAALGDEMLPDASYFDRVLGVMDRTGRAGEPLTRQAIADLYIRLRVGRLTADRILARLTDGAPPGPEFALIKLGLTDALAATAHVVGGMLGPLVLADTGEWGTARWADLILGVPGLRIGGGTDEVLRNTVAERMLNLPRSSG